MAQHALGRENDERLAPRPPHLPPQHVEILRGARGLANLNVVFGGKLHVALKAGAGMLRPLPFIPMWQEHYHTGRQIPLVVASADELIDDDLRAVSEVTELRFPKHERFGVVAAESIFKTEASSFRQR